MSQKKYLLKAESRARTQKIRLHDPLLLLVSNCNLQLELY